MYDAKLALRAALMYERSEFKHMPTPEEVADTDPAWEADIETALELLRWHEQALEHPEVFDD